MNLFETHVDPKAIELVTQVLQSGYLNQGPMVEQFETRLCEEFNFCNPVTLNSCTSALHLALVLSGVQAGDEVILPAQTFISTGLAILMCGAKPVFADVDYNGNLDPLSFENKITPKTKAVMVVHWGGTPAQLDSIYKIAKSNYIKCVEDAAHALGAKYHKLYVGTCDHSDFCCFSLQAIKTLTTGDGGILCCHDRTQYIKAMKGRWFGIDKLNVVRNANGEREVNVDTLGFKYHMNDINAAIGLGNLVGLKERIKKRMAIAEIYNNSLKNVRGIEVWSEATPSYWLYTIKVDRRQDFIKKLQSKGIPASTVDTRIDKNKIFGGPFDLPTQAWFEEHQVSIPCHDKLTIDDVLLVVDTINGGW